MKVEVFEKASTFSHLGRHASELRFLLNSLENEPNKVLEVGSGCIEPLYFAQMLPPESTIHAVDVNEDINRILSLLTEGSKIRLSSLADIVCNKNADGTPRLNSDLTNPKVLNQGLMELELAGLNPENYFSKGFFQKPNSGAKIIPIAQEMGAYAAQNPLTFDFAYAGVVLLNVAKYANTEKLIQITRNILSSVKSGGIFGVGTNPAGLYGENGTPAVLEAAGGTITDLLTDHLNRVNIGGTFRLFGGNCVRVTKTEDGEAYSALTKEEIESRIESDPVLSRIDVTYQALPGESLSGSFAEGGDNLLLAAIRTEKGYETWATPYSELENVLPERERQPFLLIPRYDVKS